MGSLDAVRYLRCRKCNGLFSEPKDAEAHVAICEGDVTATVCELVACKKVNYIKYVQPHVKRRTTPVVHVYRCTRKPKIKKDAKQIPTRCTTETEKVTPDNVTEDEMPTPATRRYGLRKGASDALHARISSMQQLLGVRLKPERPIPTEITNLPSPTTAKASETSETVQEVGGSVESDERTEHTTLEPSVEPQQARPEESPQEAAVLEDDDISYILNVTPQNNKDNVDDIGAPCSSTIRLQARGYRSARERDLITCLLSRIKVEVPDPPVQEEAAAEVPRVSQTTDEHTYSHVIEEQDNTENASKDKELEQTDDDLDAAVLESDVRVSNRLRLKQRKNRGGVKVKVQKVEADAQGVYHCNLCKYTSCKQGMFIRHMGAHNNGEMYTCEFCDAKFVYRRLYKQHLGIHKGFPCDVCAKMFSRRHDLSRHIDTTHSATKKYVCEICGYKCRHHQLYKDHMRKHTNDRYRCPEPACLFETIYRRALMHHRSTVHNAEKHIACDLCDYKTNDNCAFSKHKRTHSVEKAFSCGLCDYKAHSLSYVTMHQATHKQEKVYECDQCDYSSVRPTGIRSHMMKHIGVKPWQCPNCEYSSTTRHKVARHLSMRHKGSGQPIRRNITIKFDVNAFRVDRGSGSTAVADGNTKQQPAPTIEAESMLGHKYMVIEMIDDTTGTALSSGLVGEEVVVREEIEDTGNVQQPLCIISSDESPNLGAPTPEGPPHSDDAESLPLCLYKCALCQVTHPVLEVVQEHMTNDHPDFIAAEIIDAATAEAAEGESNELQEDAVTMEVTMETEEVACDYPERGVSEQEEEQQMGETIGMATLVAYPRQTVTMQDDAVSTAVQSILHLQHIPLKDDGV